MQNMPIAIFRGDDTDALGYQTIVGTIKTDLDLTGCKAVFRYLSFSAEFDPIPEDKKLTVIIPASETKKLPPGLGYASLRVYDAEGKLCTFSNRIMVFVATKTPMFGNAEFEVDFNVRPELEPLKIFVGPNPDDFDEYRGFLEKVIDRASAEKYGLAMLLDAIDSDLGADDGVAATPAAVKAAYAAIIKKLTDDYYTKEETDEAIDRVAAYYITYDAAGNPFPTYAALANATTVYSGGEVRVPTRNDYCVVLADETHQGAEYRYIYAVADGETTGSWQPQFPVEGVMTVDQTVTKDSQNPVSGGGVWSAIWGTLSTLPTGFSSLYDWCVSQLAGKVPTSRTVNGKALSSDVTLTGADIAVSGTDATKIDAALAGKASTADATLTAVYADVWAFTATLSDEVKAALYAENAAAAENDYALTITDRYLYVGGYMVADLSGEELQKEIEHPRSLAIQQVWGIGDAVATRISETAHVQVYQLGSQSTKPLATAAQGVKADAALPATNVVAPSTSASDSGKAADAKATGDALAGKQSALSDTQLANIAAVPNKANTSDLRYTLPETVTTISSASSEVVSGETIYYGAATLADRTQNQVFVLVALDELRVTIPPAVSGKVRDFGLVVAVGLGEGTALTAPALVPVAPTGETITLMNAEGEMPTLADGTTTASGFTVLYFTEIGQGTFLVKGEQIQEVA